MGIAADIIEGILSILHPNSGVCHDITASGLPGQQGIILKEVDRFVYSITLLADPNNSNTVLIGFNNGVPSFPMAAGGVLSIRCKNPSRLNMTAKFLGSASDSLHAIEA